MVVDVAWGSLVVNVPKSEMLLLQTVPVEIRQLDLTDFRYALHDAQDGELGMSYAHIHEHNTTVIVAGVTLAQVVEIVNDYTITFEDGLYNVNVVGGNSNVADRVNKNQVGVNTANSAGLQDSTSLQAASFGDGAVALDQTNGVSGTTYPIGTKGMPAGNMVDARAIALDKNMAKILVLGTATMDTNDDISDLTLMGTNPMTSVVNVLPGANTSNVYIRDLYFMGELDGGSVLRDCVLGSIQYFNGYIEHCALTSNTIYINGVGVLLNCASGATATSDPILDLTDSTELSIRNYDGNLKLISNINANMNDITIDGRLTIDATCVNGVFNIYGDGYIVDNSTGTCIVNDFTTDTKEEVSDAVWAATTRELTSAIGTLTAQEVWEYTTRVLTSAGAGGATAQEVWEYATRSLTEATGLTAEENAHLLALVNYDDAAVVAGIGELVDFNEGSWKIVSNQMIYYRRDGTELMRFNLLDSAGQPISRGAMQRIKV